MRRTEYLPVSDMWESSKAVHVIFSDDARDCHYPVRISKPLTPEIADLMEHFKLNQLDSLAHEVPYALVSICECGDPFCTKTSHSYLRSVAISV